MAAIARHIANPAGMIPMILFISAIAPGCCRQSSSMPRPRAGYFALWK
jgi:hypothetical protein